MDRHEPAIARVDAQSRTRFTTQYYPGIPMPATASHRKHLQWHGEVFAFQSAGLELIVPAVPESDGTSPSQPTSL